MLQLLQQLLALRRKRPLAPLGARSFVRELRVETLAQKVRLHAHLRGRLLGECELVLRLTRGALGRGALILALRERLLHGRLLVLPCGAQLGARHLERAHRRVELGLERFRVPLQLRHRGEHLAAAAAAALACLQRGRSGLRRLLLQLLDELLVGRLALVRLVRLGSGRAQRRLHLSHARRQCRLTARRVRTGRVEALRHRLHPLLKVGPLGSQRALERRHGHLEPLALTHLLRRGRLGTLGGQTVALERLALLGLSSGKL